MATMKMMRFKNGGFFMFFLLLNSFTLLSYSQSTPQSYYPYLHPPPSMIPSPVPPPNSPSPSRASTHKIIAAVGATAASTLVVAGVFFLLCSSCFGPRRRTESVAESNQTHPLPLSRSEFARFGPNVKGLIVDEDGLDVLYWRKLRDNSGGFHKEPFDRARVRNGNGSGNGNGNGNGRMEHITRGRSSSSQGQIHPGQRSDGGGVGRPPLAPPAPPPPPPPLPVKKIPAIPPPPPVPKKKAPMPPPPPPRKVGSGDSPSKPPAAPKPPSTVEDEEGGKDQVTLKPLHWEKLNVDTDHSMVWDKIQKGSFQYNGDMMEAMFGVLATNRKSPKQESPITKPGESSNPKIVILDPRKSQNTAIVLKSLGVPRTELTESLLSGKGLALETLEKLARSAPTQEEESKIVAFDGDVRNLAYAESFLYELLTAVPSAFTRANAMLFKLSYDQEILGVKESLQTMELACSEMRSRAIFLKLLEAILKAGNRLNAGTARGDAKAFNLNTLLKLSDYKSSDGKTTLLHFVVHEVVRTEGRRCILSKTATQPEDSTPKEDKEKEFLKLGLPIVGGLSSDFSNVKKAAFIDYDGLKSTLACLGNRVDSTRELVSKCKSGGDGAGGFLREMKDFLESAEAEIKIIQEEHVRVMSLVKKTTQYYQAGASSESNPLQLFFIVKGFLGMVDQACVEIARSLKQKKAVAAKTNGDASGSGASQSEVLRTRVTFPRLPEHFLSDKSSASDSEDET